MRWERDVNSIIFSFKFYDFDDYGVLWKEVNIDGRRDLVRDKGGFLERIGGGREGGEVCVG